MQQHRKTYNTRDSGLSHHEQEMLIKSFPHEIKFSYEKSTHKKVLSDLYVIIPKGKKYFVWFTHHDRKNICLFLEICNRTHNILNIFYRHVSFHDVLSYGTIFYGTLFRQGQGQGQDQSDIFSVENIYYYKGQNIQDHTYETKLKIIKDILTQGYNIIRDSSFILRKKVLYLVFRLLQHRLMKQFGLQGSYHTRCIRFNIGI